MYITLCETQKTLAITFSADRKVLAGQVGCDPSCRLGCLRSLLSHAPSIGGLPIEECGLLSSVVALGPGSSKADE